MAASQYTSPTPNNPYVLPVDLGLLAKVNQYKQATFYQNAEKENEGLNQLNNLDIINKQQHDYLKGKVSDLVSNINGIGGMDYSDPNVSNTLQGYTSNVYSDPVILNGVSSTSDLRSYMKNTDDMKTDPKLNQYYDPAREWWDMEATANPNNANNYINGGLNAKYSGPTSPAPYLGNDFDILSKNITKLHPNIVQSIGPSGNRFYLDQITNKEVDPETIRGMVDGEIDGKVADQLKVHAAYNYAGLTGGTYNVDQGAAEYVGNAQTLLNQGTARIATLKQDIATEADLTKKADYQSQLDKLQGTPAAPGIAAVPGYMDQYTNAIKSGKATFTKKWNESPTEAMYTLYKNKLSNDIVNTYSYSQQTHQLQLDQEQMYIGKVNLEAAKLDKTVIWNADGTFKFSGAADNVDPSQAGPLTTLGQNTEADADLNKDKVSTQSLSDENATINKGLSDNLMDLVYKSALHSGNQGLIDMATTQFQDNPGQNPVTHPNILRQVAHLTGSNTLSEDALKMAIGMNSNPGFAAPNLGVKLTPDVVKYFKSIIDVMDQGANGQDIAGKIPDADKWANYLQDYSIQHNTIAYNNNLVKAAQEQAISQNGSTLTPAEQIELNKYTENPSAYYSTSTAEHSSFGSTGGSGPVNVSTFSGSPTMASALNKVGGPQKYNSTVDEMLGRTATRNNYYNILLPDSKKTFNEQYPQLINYITSHISSPQDGDKAIGVADKADISANSIVSDGKNYYISYNDSGKNGLAKGTGYAKIEPQDLEALKVPILPYPYLEKVVSGNGRLMEPIYVNPTATDNSFNIRNGITSPMAIQINNMKSSTDNLNGGEYEPSIVVNGKSYFYKDGSSSTANAALEKMKIFIQKNQTYTSFQSMLNSLDSANTR